MKVTLSAQKSARKTSQNCSVIYTVSRSTHLEYQMIIWIMSPAASCAAMSKVRSLDRKPVPSSLRQLETDLSEEREGPDSIAVL